MANTRDVLGDQETLDGLVGNTLTSLEEDGIANIKHPLYARTALTDVKFPSLTSISAGTFEGCTGITDVAQGDFPNVATINSTAFNGCTGLTEATFPSVTTMANNAFQNCSNLTKVETGTPKTAFTTPFTGCTKLKDLIVNSTEMSTLNSATGLAGTAIANYQGAVYVPADLVDTYKANANWKNYFIFSKDDYPVSEYPTDLTAYFNSGTITDTWQEIIANDSDYATKYKIGDTKGVYLGTYGMQLMELVAFDEDIRADGDTTINNGKARMTWISKNCITTHEMNATNTAANGWQGSEMRSWLSGAVLPLFPDYIQEAMVEVSKVSSTYSGGVVKDGQTTTDKIWIPSDHEVGFGDTYETTGAVYTGKFTGNTARKKTYNNSANGWWLRSANHSARFRHVNSDGSTHGSGASNAIGVVPGFCI